jgi:nucleoside-diphosphate-sugar epimerase
MRVLVIGGTGFIGPHVASCLAEQGHDVTVVHRGRTESPALAGVDFARADYQDREALAAIVTDRNVDVVVDMIAMTAEQTAPLLDVLGGRIARYVLVSSFDVYKLFGASRRKEAAERQAEPLTEEAPLRDSRFPYRGDRPRPAGNDLYDRYDKVPIEEMVRHRRDLPWTILRLPFIYGPNDHQRRFSDFIWRIAEGRPFLPIETKTAHRRATYDFVGNVAAAIALAATHVDAAGQIFNLGEEDAFCQWEWAAEIGRILAGATEIREIEAARCPPHLLRSSRMFDPEISMIVDSRRLRNRLGYTERIARSDGLRHTVEACLKAGRPRGLDREYKREDRVLYGWTYCFHRGAAGKRRRLGETLRD